MAQQEPIGTGGSIWNRMDNYGRGLRSAVMGNGPSTLLQYRPTTLLPDIRSAVTQNILMYIKIKRKYSF